MNKIYSIYSSIINIEPIKRQSIINMFWQIAITAIGFISTMYFAQKVGPAVLGAYFLFLAYDGIFLNITDGGIGGAAVKRISEGEEPNAYFSAYFVLRSTITVMIILAMLMFKDYFVELNNSSMFFWLLLDLLISIFAGAIGSGVVSEGKMGIHNTCYGIGNVLRIIFQIMAIYLGYNAASLAGGMVAGTIVAAIIEFHFFELHLVHFNWKHIKSLFVFSFWLFLTSSGMLLFTQADTILISHFMNIVDVGIYRVVLQFTLAATFTTTALRSTLWVRISRWSKNNNMDMVEKSLPRAISYSLILAVPVLVGGMILGDQLLYSFYGADFISGYWTLIILLAVQVVNVFQYLFTMYLDALNHPKESFKVTAIGIIANILLNLILIPIMGISGAAIATLVTMTLNALLAQRALSKLLSIRLERQCISNILVASFIMGLFIGIFRVLVPISSLFFSLLAIFIGGLIYTILILKLDQKICDDLIEILEEMGLGAMCTRWF